MQAPGRPDEDTAGGFRYGGWVAPYFDEVGSAIMKKQMEAADLLLGRKTYEIFASYWPERESGWPGINDVTKYVISRTMKKADLPAGEAGWKNSIILESLADIEKLKNSEGSDIKVWGSGNLVQLLLQNNLVDELWLKIYPLILGTGKKLFDSGTIPTAFTLTESTVTPSGVIIANYKLAGKIKTGTIGAEGEKKSEAN